jgi:enoyl-CoA hydratase/carnithine racemase
MRVMADSAKLAFLFTKVGLTGADMGAAYLLPRIVGSGRASELLMLGDEIDAETALSIGLANRVVSQDQVLPETMALAEKITNRPTLAISTTKRMIENEWNMDLVSALESEAQAQALLLMGEDHRAFYEAFKKKEKPRFKGR